MADTVFIVEDNEDIGYILQYFLEEEGFEVFLFPNVSAFKIALKHQKPDVFLLDVMLPDGNGIDLCKELKQNADVENIPILIMSAHAPAEKITQESMADGFIKKPFDLDTLHARLNELLSAPPLDKAQT